MILFNSMVSGNCYKVRLLAHHLGIPMGTRDDDGVLRDGDGRPIHEPTPDEIAARNASTSAHLGLPLELRELDVVDRSRRPEILGDLNPALRVPTLVLDDGRALAESNAIIDFLAEGTPYLASDAYERARTLAWQFFEQYEIEPNLAVLRFHRLFDVPASEEFLGLRRAAGTKALQALERGLSGRSFLVADAFGVADISLYGYVHVAAEAGVDLGPYPAVRAWLDRVAAQPGHITIDAVGPA